jgi:hypothetical protein
MRKGIVLLAVAVVVAVALSSAGWAQTAGVNSPPKVLQIFREEVKPGKVAAHEKIEVGWPQAFTKANFPYHYLAITSLTGPNEAWYLSAFNSFAEWEQSNKQIEENASLRTATERLSETDGEVLSGVSSIAAVYRDDLSYRPNFKVGEYRYFSVDTIRVRPGHESGFEEAWKLITASHEKSNMDEHMVIYQVVSGEKLGTFLLFQPAKSLKEVDLVRETHGAKSAYREALGEEGQKKLRELTQTGVVSHERRHFSFAPKMSYVSKEVMAAAPDFWQPKAVVAAGTSKGKVVPARKKEKGN